MAKQNASKKSDEEKSKGSATSRTRLIQDFRPFSKEQQVGKKTTQSKAPKGGRR